MVHLWPNDVDAVPRVHCQAAVDVRTTRCSSYYGDGHEAPMTPSIVQLLCRRRVLDKVEEHGALAVILSNYVTVTSVDLNNGDGCYYSIEMCF